MLLVVLEVALSPASRIDTCFDSGSDAKADTDRGETLLFRLAIIRGSEVYPSFLLLPISFFLYLSMPLFMPVC